TPCTLQSFPTRRSSDLEREVEHQHDAQAHHPRHEFRLRRANPAVRSNEPVENAPCASHRRAASRRNTTPNSLADMTRCSLDSLRSEEHTSELQSPCNLV